VNDLNVVPPRRLPRLDVAFGSQRQMLALTPGYLFGLAQSNTPSAASKRYSGSLTPPSRRHTHRRVRAEVCRYIGDYNVEAPKKTFPKVGLDQIPRDGGASCRAALRASRDTADRADGDGLDSSRLDARAHRCLTGDRPPRAEIPCDTASAHKRRVERGCPGCDSGPEGTLDIAGALTG
jgi:hypothetical protein